MINYEPAPLPTPADYSQCDVCRGTGLILHGTSSSSSTVIAGFYGYHCCLQCSGIGTVFDLARYLERIGNSTAAPHIKFVRVPERNSTAG